MPPDAGICRVWWGYVDVKHGGVLRRPHVPVLLSFLFIACGLLMGHRATAQDRIEVADGRALAKAIGQAKPGDVITIAPGRYPLGRITVRASGRRDAPIRVRALTPGSVLLEATSTTGFKVAAPYWTFENLEIRGRCSKHANCEHAFHIVGAASGTVLRGNILWDFNAPIKGNGENTASGRMFPNDVLIEGNAFFNTSIRDTRKPVSGFDVVGGKRWIVRGNFFADFAKSSGSQVSYAGFLKGNSSNGVYERNLVICEWRHTGGIRVGLSFGGGGTSNPAICDAGDCTHNHSAGIIRNNIIANCVSDVGIYVNKSRDIGIYNNLLFNTYGIDVRFPVSTADVQNNILAGGIRNRDGAHSTTDANIVAGRSYAAALPGTARYVKKRLTGQDKKYPNYIDPEDVAWAKGLVDSLLAWGGDTWLGHGSDAIRALYADADAMDLRLSVPDEVIDRGVVLRTVPDDFCGHPRKLPPHDLGPIEYGAGFCDIRQMPAYLAAVDALARDAARR